MNRTNKLMIGAVFGIGIAYAAVCFGWSVYQEYLTGTYQMLFLFPTSLTLDGLFRDLFGYAAVVNQYYLDPLLSLIPADFAKYGKYLVILLTAFGFMLTAFGYFNRVTRNLSSGEEEAKDKLFTHRRFAFLRMLALPWNGIAAACKVHILLIIPLIFILPFSVPFALLADIVMIVPFIIARIVTGLKVSSASKKDEDAYRRNTEYAVCPKCKRNFARPKVRCRCGRLYEYPVPNGFGYRVHTCDKGHDMPCTAAGGKRGLLNTVCPFCESEIVTHEARPIVIATVGAPSSGKTGLMLSSLRALDGESKRCGFELDPFTAGVDRNRMRVAETSPNTEPGEHDSEIVFVKSPRFWEKEIIFNDISGMEYEPREDKVLFEEYFTYTDGLMFAIDGTALIARFEGRTPPADTFAAFMSMFRDVTGTGPSSVSTVPFAVVVTKTDIQRVSSVVRPSASSDSDAAVRKYLVDNGQESFVKTVESAFSNVRYYAACATGANSGSALMPLKWIISEADGDMRSILGQ